jgi:hypothetical protein
MASLDSRTVIVVACLVYALLAGAVSVMGVPLRRHVGPVHWAVGLCGWALGALLVALQGVAPAWLAIIVGNGCLIVSTCVVAQGLARFLGAPSRRRLHLVVSAGSVLGMAAFTLVRGSFAGRVMVFSLAALILSADMASVLARYRGGESSAAIRFLLGTWASMAVFHALRLVVTFTVAVPPEHLLQSHWATGWSLLVMMLQVLALVSGLMALAASRFADELAADRARLAETNERLRAALENVRVLSGLLRICAWCKKIRNDEGVWEQMEVYVQRHSDASFTHGVCPACAEKVRAGPGPA